MIGLRDNGLTPGGGGVAPPSTAAEVLAGVAVLGATAAGVDATRAFLGFRPLPLVQGAATVGTGAGCGFAGGAGSFVAGAGCGAIALTAGLAPLAGQNEHVLHLQKLQWFLALACLQNAPHASKPKSPVRLDTHVTFFADSASE